MSDGRKLIADQEELESELRAEEKKRVQIDTFRKVIAEDTNKASELLDKLQRARLILHRLDLPQKAMSASDHERAAELYRLLNEVETCTR